MTCGVSRFSFQCLKVFHLVHEVHEFSHVCASAHAYVDVDVCVYVLCICVHEDVDVNAFAHAYFACMFT